MLGTPVREATDAIVLFFSVAALCVLRLPRDGLLAARPTDLARASLLSREFGGGLVVVLRAL
jgi:hypothetical protein